MWANPVMRGAFGCAWAVRTGRKLRPMARSLIGFTITFGEPLFDFLESHWTSTYSNRSAEIKRHHVLKRSEAMICKLIHRIVASRGVEQVVVILFNGLETFLF